MHKILDMLDGKQVFVNFRLDSGQNPLNGLLSKLSDEGFYTIRSTARDQRGQNLGEFTFYFHAKDVVTVSEQCSIESPQTIAMS